MMVVTVVNIPKDSLWLPGACGVQASGLGLVAAMATKLHDHSATQGVLVAQ